MKKLIILSLVLFSNYCYCQDYSDSVVDYTVVKVVENETDLNKDNRLYFFMQKLNIDICDYKLMGMHEIISITDSLNAQGYNITINTRTFKGDFKGGYNSKFTKVIHNDNSLKKIDKKYMLLFYDENEVEFYYVE